MLDRLEFRLKRIREKLWVKPLFIAVLSVVGAFLAKSADHIPFIEIAPEVSEGTVETLLKVISSSMLVIATFAVASMVSAYQAASSTATPRTFPLIIADDVSQNALSTFIGAFIYSIVALISLLNGFYGPAGRFALFIFTLAVFAAVILTFVHWTDRIARLGRLGATIDKVETAAREAMERRKKRPCLGGVPFVASENKDQSEEGNAVLGDYIGYVQRIEMDQLQKQAEQYECEITVRALPGAFVSPDQPLAWVHRKDGALDDELEKCIREAFVVGDDRLFDDDPRFGVIVLAEIASRALSPAVNDPGTAIDIIGTLVRLFASWSEEPEEGEDCEFNRVNVPPIAIDDLFDDAFTGIARDGAASIEVAVRLQKALKALASSGDEALETAARRHSKLALERARLAMELADDIERLEIVYNDESNFWKP